VAAAIALCLAVPATAKIFTEVEAYSRGLCSDQPDAAHPRKVELVHAILPGEGDSLEITDVYVAYGTGMDRPAGEKMIVRVQVLRADGSKVKLARVSARRDADGGLGAEMDVPGVTVHTGDAIRARYEFRGFGPLGSEPPDRCFALALWAGTFRN
jgi:hypothetical protein